MIAGLYLTRVVAVRILAVLLGIAALAVGLDMVENATEVISRHGADKLAEYALLRLPVILLTVLPLCVLIGAVLGFLTMAMRSEMVVLRAAGLNTIRMLALMIPLCLALAVTHNLLASWLAPAAERALAVKFPRLSDAPKLSRELWLRDWGAVIRVGSASAGAATLADITIFELDSSGRLSQRIDAAAARYTEGGWTLSQVHLQLPEPPAQDLAELRWESRLTPAGIMSAARRSEMVDASEVRDILSGAGCRSMPCSCGTVTPPS